MREKWEKRWPQYQTRWLAYCADRRLRPDRAHAYGFIWMSPLIAEHRPVWDQDAFSAWIWEKVEKRREAA